MDSEVLRSIVNAVRFLQLHSKTVLRILIGGDNMKIMTLLIILLMSTTCCKKEYMPRSVSKYRIIGSSDPFTFSTNYYITIRYAKGRKTIAVTREKYENVELGTRYYLPGVY